MTLRHGSGRQRRRGAGALVVGQQLRCAWRAARRRRTAVARNVSTIAVGLLERVHPRRRRRRPARRCARGPARRSRCCRPSAARQPGTLLAAICSPLPEPPITTPRLPSSATTRRRGLDAERRVVVLGVVGGRADVDDLVAGLGEVLDEMRLQLEAGVVGSQVDTHARHSASSGSMCPVTVFEQDGYDLRVEWGLDGVRALGPHCAVLVIVDVLVFTTTVDIARRPGRAGAAAAVAGRAGGRGGGAAGATLAPSGLPTRGRPARPRRRGGAGRCGRRRWWGCRRTRSSRSRRPTAARCAAAAAETGATVLAGCLRNASAVAAAAVGDRRGPADRGRAGGERWQTATRRCGRRSRTTSARAPSRPR